MGDHVVVVLDKETVLGLKNCAAKRDWKCFKEKIHGKKIEYPEQLLLEPVDPFKNTVLHAVAGSSGNAELLRVLLDMLHDENLQRDALTKGNVEGNTLLHVAVQNLMKDCLDTVDVIMEFGKKILHPNGYLKELLEHKNTKKETPVFKAAKHGNLNVLKHIHNKYQPLRAKEHLPPSSRNDGRSRPILQNCLLKFKFDVAIWLMKEVVQEDEKLAQQTYWISVDDEDEYREGFTCFQLLSKMPMAFRSKDTQEMTLRQKLIYHMLPDEGYESELELDGAGNNSFKSTTDTERGQPADNDEIKKPPKSIFSRINYAAWKFVKKENYAAWKLLAKGFKCVGKIWEQKKKHKYAEQLARLLVKDEKSLMDYKPPSGDKMTLTLFRDFPPNVTEKKKEIDLRKRIEEEVQFKQKLKERKERKSEEKDNKANEGEKPSSPSLDEVKKKETKWETPLFLAAASGIKEVVQIILDYHPEAISHVNEKGLNILHMAIKLRQLEIYDYIKGKEDALKALKKRISNNGRTILHQAASMEYYREQALPGVAYQLQNELEWYHRVKSIVPQHYLMHCDNEGLTAGDLLDVEHAEMHDQAKQWMKETAQSCSTVAVLIAGVVFAAAYTIPGGTSKNGKAELLNAPAFQFFTIMDVMALACSLYSVVMFLSILTSPFELWDFHKSLHQMLKLGFIMLFCALITTILAFAATIWLTVHMEGNKKTTTIIYSLAFIVVSVLGLKQFPFGKIFEDMVKQCFPSIK